MNFFSHLSFLVCCYGGSSCCKKGSAITRKRVRGWIEAGCFKYGAMGSKRQGDEAAVLIIKNELAIVYCVRFADAEPGKNPYLNWAARLAYEHGVPINWYAVEERVGKHTARVKVFQNNPEAQAAIVNQASKAVNSGDSWCRTFSRFGSKPRVPELV